MGKRLLYDGFAGAGGAAKGYMDAGFRVLGIDNQPQPHYVGDDFVQMDFFDFVAAVVNGEYPMPDAWHCSPPCQGYSIMRNLPWLKQKEYPLLILPVREMLEHIGLPYVLENVMGARHGSKQLAKRGLEAHGMKAAMLCGTMFGRPFYRHRLFETNWFWMQPGHPKHVQRIRDGRSLGGRARDIVFKGTLNNGSAQGYGHQKGAALVREAMGVPWMTRAELSQAIPPAYTEFIGRALLARLGESVSVEVRE